MKSGVSKVCESTAIGISAFGSVEVGGHAKSC